MRRIIFILVLFSFLSCHKRLVPSKESCTGTVYCGLCMDNIILPVPVNDTGIIVSYDDPVISHPDIIYCPDKYNGYTYWMAWGSPVKPKFEIFYTPQWDIRWDTITSVLRLYEFKYGKKLFFK